MVEVSCSDGDCKFQCDEYCHREDIEIDDNNKCITKMVE